MPKDYYATLGVGRDASSEDIKSAFRHLAHQHHPDKKGGDEAKFKEINEAYQALSDPEKRKRYDQYGSTEGFSGFGQQGSPFGQGVEFDMGDLGDLFGGIGDIFGFGGRRSRGPRSRASRGQDLEITLAISFHEMALGVKRDIEIKKFVSCRACSGSGVAKGSTLEDCKTCAGRGEVVSNRRTVFGQFQSVSICAACSGAGKLPKERCKECAGQGRAEERSTVSITIPAGINDGDTLKLSGAGEAGATGGVSGNLYVHIRVKPEQGWEREGDDVVSQFDLSFSQAGLGVNVPVETIDGAVDLAVPAGVQSGQRLKIRGKGIGRLRGSGRGDHLVEISIKTPTHLSRKARELLEQLKGEGV